MQFLEQVNATQPGTYPIHLTINYRDQSGELKQKIVEQDINVYATPVADNGTFPLIVGG